MLKLLKRLKPKEWCLAAVALVFIVAQVYLDLEMPEFSKRFQENDDVFHRIVEICASDKKQAERFSLLCGKYGEDTVIRLCCDLVVLSSGEGIPLPIWDYATQHCSRTPSISLDWKRQITEKELTELFRNCIVTERTDGKTFFVRKKKQFQ